MNLQAPIGRLGRYEGDKDQVGTIWEEIRLAKHIAKQGLEVALQAKEDMDKIKARALTETAAVKVEFQSTIALVKRMDKVQRRLINYFKMEVKILKRGMIDAPRLEQWSEDMDLAITQFLKLLVERMKHLEINSGTRGGGVGMGISEIASFKDK